MYSENIDNQIQNLVQPMKASVLEDFKIKKKLGQGSYGEVVLAENKKGEQVALKMIIKENMDESTRANLKGEIACMKSIKDLHVVRILEQREDDVYFYIACEFCEMGDLFNYQAKKDGKRFTVEEAAGILSQILLGLEAMHQKNILHRDIKSQNILVTRVDDSEVFKIADLGFSKEIDETQGTILGTEKFMAPEIYEKQFYGYQVDMWAFGVVFYFMMNAQYPFNLNPYVILEKKSQELKKLAMNFSYKASVEKSRLKNISTCTPETEDLFKKIFQIKKDKRIRFDQLRQHAIFKKFFKNGAGDSKILYKKNLKVPSTMKRESRRSKNDDIMPVTKIYKGQKNKEKAYIQGHHSQLKFLADSESEVTKYSNEAMPIEQIQALRYCLIKMFLVLLKDFIGNLSVENLKRDKPELNWNEFCSGKMFKKLLSQYQFEFCAYELKLSNLYSDCLECLPQIDKINENFRKIFQNSITAEKCGKQFTSVYKKIIRRGFEKMEAIKEERKSYIYLTVVFLICYVFEKIIKKSNQELKQIFKVYATEQSENIDEVMDFEDFRSWVQRTSRVSLNTTFESIVKTCFK